MALACASKICRCRTFAEDQIASLGQDGLAWLRIMSARLIVSCAGYCASSGRQCFQQRAERCLFQIETGTITFRRKGQYGFTFADLDRLVPDDRDPCGRRREPECSRYSEAG